jgi:uncharacterized MAPEG superfamily protein
MNPASMTLAYWCVLVAALLPLVCAGLAKREGLGRRRSEGGYDNENPRAWLSRQEGRSARANAAQANSFEALPFFIGAVVIAHQLAASQTLVDALAAAFVILRIAYIALYVNGQGAWRSLVWVLALAVNITLFLAGVF